MVINNNLVSDFYKPFEYEAALIKCAESVVFNQRLEYELSEFGLMLNHYVVGSPAYLEILGQMEDTDSSFLNLINSGAVCGEEDGLPRISFARENFNEEILLPSLLALYLLGFIGWVGRSYLIFARRTDCPAQAEIIINLPVASGLAVPAILWPIAAGLEIIDGEFVVPDSDVTNEVYGQGKL